MEKPVGWPEATIAGPDPFELQLRAGSGLGSRARRPAGSGDARPAGEEASKGAGQRRRPGKRSVK